MGMVFCRGCGKEIHDSASSCPQCGATQQIKKNSTQSVDSNKELDMLSETWKTKFSIIEKAGGITPNGLSYVNAKALSFGENFKISFNPLAFLFGIFYYLFKGMWKRGLLKLGIGITISIVLEAILGRQTPEAVKFAVNLIPSAIFGTFANMDYYKKIKLGDDGWW